MYTSNICNISSVTFKHTITLTYDTMLQQYFWTIAKHDMCLFLSLETAKATVDPKKSFHNPLKMVYMLICN